MKIRNLFLINCFWVIVLSLLVSNIQAALIAQWHFDEAPGTTIAHDSIGTHDGQLSGDANFIGGGISNNALQISRNGNGFVNIGDYFDFTGGDFSIVAWIKSQTPLPDSIFVGKHRSTIMAGYFLCVNYQFGGLPNKPTFYQHGYSYVNANKDVTDANWHQVVGVYQQGGTDSIYVDGIFQNSIPSTPIIKIDAPFLVGGISFGNTPAGMFDGLVDEVQLYNNALTSDEIMYLFEHPGTGPTCKGPVPGDLNGNCKVDFEDFAIMASHWLECNLDPAFFCE